jgi:hypothetical protein
MMIAALIALVGGYHTIFTVRRGLHHRGTAEALLLKKHGFATVRVAHNGAGTGTTLEEGEVLFQDSSGCEHCM